MSVTFVDLRTSRHNNNSKKLFKSVCDIVEGLNFEIAGFASVIWADDGTAGTAYKTGGCVELGGLPVYAHQKLSKLIDLIYLFLKPSNHLSKSSLR